MDNQELAVVVTDLYKSFKLPHDQHSGIKQLLINFNKKSNKSYEVQHVLENISFNIKKGEFFGIVGRNGSGKSTLLKLLAGIYAAEKGTAQVNGSLTPFIELGVGFNPELTGRENVYLNGALLGFSRREMDAMYAGIVRFAELGKFMDQKLKNYSSGMQVRLAFSIAIRAKSDILLIDEVLAVGDSAFQQKCFDYFERLKREKRTIIIVTHDMSAVRRFCTRAIYLEKGRIIQEGDPFEITETYIEKNIDTEKQPEDAGDDNDDGLKLSDAHTLTAVLTQVSENTVKVDFGYNSADKREMYVGISIIRDGVSIAEITTSLDKPLHEKGNLSFTVNTSMFNEGVYQVTAALFLLANRELVAVAKEKNIFNVHGPDITRGAAFKLVDTWTYGE